MKITKSETLIITSFIAFLFVFSTFAVYSPVAPAVVKASSPSPSAALNQITWVDYGGSDAAGVADLQAGKIDEYNFQLTPSASASLGSGFNQYVSPGSIYGIYVNPQNTTAGTGNYNPFYFQKVRFALNYLIDRNYFAQTIEGGKFVTCITPICAEPDAVTVAGAMATFANVTFNFQVANTTIYNTLIAQKGISYVAGHYYVTTTIEGHVTSTPVTVYLFDRIDDPIRHAFMQYLNSQLQKVGFNTVVTTGTLSDAYVTVFGTDPASAKYDIYPASNSQIWGYTDSNAVNFLSAGYYEDLPASDHYGLNWIGGWDNTTQEPYTTYTYDQADKLGAIPLLTSNFTTLAQRAQELSALAYWGMLGATYIPIGTSLAPQAASTAVSGITPNFLLDPIANFINMLTMDVSASGATGVAHSIKIGVRHVTNGNINPVGGDNDAYSDAMQSGTWYPIFSYGPSSGYSFSTGMKYKINANHAINDVSVPTSAIWFNGTSDSWQNVASGTNAQDDVTVDMSRYLSNTKWADGQPVTLADSLMQYIEEGLVVAGTGTLHTATSGGPAGIYSVDYGAVKGIEVLNSTALRVWTTSTFFPDANLAAIGALVDVLQPMGFSAYTNGGGWMPWQMYAAMNTVVNNHLAAFTTASAGKLSLPWLNLINPTDVANVKAALDAAGSTIPPEITQLQTMTGQSWVTAANAAAGYTAASSFIATNGVATISDGPFYISKYSGTTSPVFAVETKNPYFQAGSVLDPNLFAPAVVLTPQVTVPPVLQLGSTITVTVLQTQDGTSTSTPSAGANVIVQFVGSGKIQYSTNGTTGSNGQFSVTVPTNLATGSYLLNIYSYSVASSLVKPIAQSITLTPQSHTTSTTQSTTQTTATTPTSATSTTSSTTSTTASTTSTTTGVDYTPYIYGAIVVVIVVIIGVVLARRGRGGT